MINLSLDKHDFVAAVEGFARGSHLRQHVWREIVFKSIPQMSEPDMNFFWWIFRRNLWDSYFCEMNGKMHTSVGHEDYIHALAALHLGNRSYVTFKPKGKEKNHKALCYAFQGNLCPLYVDGGTELQCFNDFIPGEWVLREKKLPIPDNNMVPIDREDLWEDLSIYNDDDLVL